MRLSGIFLHYIRKLFIKRFKTGRTGTPGSLGAPGRTGRTIRTGGFGRMGATRRTGGSGRMGATRRTGGFGRMGATRRTVGSGAIRRRLNAIRSLVLKRMMIYFLIMLLCAVVLPLIIVLSNGGFFDLENKSLYDIQKIKELPDGDKKTLSVYFHQEKKVAEVVLEEYIKGVVAAEMPASFEKEALKAQAVAARTYAFARHLGMYSKTSGFHPKADVCTDPAHCQAYISKKTAYSRWGLFNAVYNWKKISGAVEETAGIIVLYEEKPINTLFHANAGGKTENAEDIWHGKPVPYLQSVDSPGDMLSPSFEREIVINHDLLLSRLKESKNYINRKNSGKEKDLPKNADIKIISRTTGGSVAILLAAGIELTGSEFRKLFDLPSAKFEFQSSKDGNLKILCKGYGHGVGMSQWGAKYLAMNGFKYDEILKYYYKGVYTGSIY